MTRYGTLIEELIRNNRSHMTAEQIFTELKKKTPGVVFATVYNNLNRMCDEKKIIRLCLDGSPDRYDVTDRHDHLICWKCGSLSDFRFEDITASLSEQLHDQIISYDLRVSWLCPECRKKQDI